MLRKLAAVALCAASLVSAPVFAFDRASSDKPEKAVAAKHLLASSQGHEVTHDGNNFKVNGQRVEHYDLDASLRKPNALKELFKSDRSKLEVSRIGAGYALKRHEQLRGGGGGGAWLGSWLGYGGVMAGSKIVTGLIVWPIALVCPPAAIAVGAVLETVVPVIIQPVAITAGVAGGIALGAATGPI